jgi:hypothetical protein
MNTAEAAKKLASKIAEQTFHPRNQKAKYERLTNELTLALVAFKTADDTPTAPAEHGEQEGSQ